MLLTVAGVVTLLTFIGAIAMWPGDRSPTVPAPLPLELFSGKVLRTDQVPCTGVAEAVNATDCAEAVVRVLDGPDAGTEVRIEASVSGGTPRMRAGDTIQMNQFSDLSGGDPIYEFWQFERSRPLWVLAILFVFVVLAIGRLRGLRALCALMISLLTIVYFMIPSILTDHDPVLAALVAGSLITLCTLTISYGFTATAMTAFVGIVASLLITGVLAQLFVSASRLSGLGDDQAIYLQAVTGGIDLRGLLLAGMVIGALGVLDDVTVTPASASRVELLLGAAAQRRFDRRRLTARWQFGEEVGRRCCNAFDGAAHGSLVGAGDGRQRGDLPSELQRGGFDLGGRRLRFEPAQRRDVAAHADQPTDAPRFVS